MPKTRREFSREFKRETVALLESSGRPLMRVATGVGICIDAAELASGGSRWERAITGGVAAGVAAAAVAGGPGVRDQMAGRADVPGP